MKILLDDRAKLWVAWNPDTKTCDAAVVTEIIQYPQKREFRLWLVGGRDMKAWATEGRLMVEAYARANGCELAAGAMRKGWVRVAGDGWKVTGCMLEKVL